jgi:3-hydroxyacyl-[acyl-carrier-protein] dehydratase
VPLESGPAQALGAVGAADPGRYGAKSSFGFVGVKFCLVDRIVELESGRRIVTLKAVSLAEEYLADHFPKFPVLPGVLMVEAMVQASAWLVRESLNFAPSLVLLKAARNVTYKSFVPPGQVLTVESTCQEMRAEESSFVARGELEGREIVRGRLTLRHLTLSEVGGGNAALDERLRADQRARFGLLWKGCPAGQPTGTTLDG